MSVAVTEEFRSICIEIVSQKRCDAEWAAIESDDMFQSQNFTGGFDASEMAFCFAFVDTAGTEHWFQLTSAEVSEVASGRTKTLDARRAEK